MKNIIMVAVVAVCVLLTSAAQAKEKFTVTIDESYVSVTIGKIEYVSDVKTPNELRMVRVWKGSDSLLYDLTATSVDYTREYSNVPKEGNEMTKVQAAHKWAEYLKKFENLTKEIEVRFIR